MGASGYEPRRKAVTALTGCRPRKHARQLKPQHRVSSANAVCGAAAWSICCVVSKAAENPCPPRRARFARQVLQRSAVAFGIRHQQLDLPALVEDDKL